VTKNIFLFVLIAFAATSFIKQGPDMIEFGNKHWAKSWSKLNEEAWLQKMEVSNASYQLFLDDLQASGETAKYIACYPDTLGWMKETPDKKPYVSFYFKSPAFGHYPVVNISYKAADAYCQWLTAEYAALKKKSFGEVVFRLPGREEWMRAAAGGNADDRLYPWNGLYLKNNRGEKLCNYRSDLSGITPAASETDKKTSYNQITSVTAPVNSFFPNDLGLYNVCGNVAEMVQEKGVAVGGSYLDAGDKVRIQSSKTYNESAADIGFRVLMERKGE